MKLLITGSTGFIGRHLVETLSKTDYEIICLVREKSNIHVLPKTKNTIIKKISFEDENQLAKSLQGVHTVIHLAGQMGAFGVPYEKFYQTNCILTEVILRVAQRVGVQHFIYCSTPGVLGFGKRLASEGEPYAPRNPYEKTKVIAENIIKEFCINNPSIHYTIIRPDFVYGPGDMRRVKMYKNIKNRKFVLTTSGKSYLHPTYIEDVVSGFMCCLENEAAFNDTFNIAAENDICVKNYLETIAYYTNSKLIQINIGITLSRLCATVIDSFFRTFLHKEGFVSKNKIDFLAMDHSSSIKHAREKIGYRPRYTCENGIQQTIQWCKNNNLL